MGYSTIFIGALDFNKPVTNELQNYINTFSATRRMERNNEKIKELYPNWKQQCWHGNLGKNGEYFIGDIDNCGRDISESIINYNEPPMTQPGLWCQWIIKDNQLVWNEVEKFYSYVDWLEYLITNFFEPDGYILNGKIHFQGEDSDDNGMIIVTNNNITVTYTDAVLTDFTDVELIEEVKRRGYHVLNGVLC